MAEGSLRLFRMETERLVKTGGQRDRLVPDGPDVLRCLARQPERLPSWSPDEMSALTPQTNMGADLVDRLPGDRPGLAGALAQNLFNPTGLGL